MFRAIAWSIYKSLYLMFQKLGIHIVPNHYYWPIPDTSKLRNDLWQKNLPPQGIDFNEAGQLKLLELFVSMFKSEYSQISLDRNLLHASKFYLNNPSFRSVDAEILYCMIRHFKPRIIFEIGSGYSTYLSAEALLKNKSEGGGEAALIANDPYPNQTLMSGFPGLSRVIPRKAEDIPLTDFAQLHENDILFIDSSHILKIGGDVQYEYLEILPRLNKGVIVHVHDIFLPAEYPKDWILHQHRFWTEQYLLQAFLTFNDHFEVLWAGSFMHLRHSANLEASFDSYAKNQCWPGSFWIRKVK